MALSKIRLITRITFVVFALTTLAGTFASGQPESEPPVYVIYNLVDSPDGKLVMNFVKEKKVICVIYQEFLDKLDDTSDEAIYRYKDTSSNHTENCAEAVFHVSSIKDLKKIEEELYRDSCSYSQEDSKIKTCILMRISQLILKTDKFKNIDATSNLLVDSSSTDGVDINTHEFSPGVIQEAINRINNKTDSAKNNSKNDSGSRENRENTSSDESTGDNEQNKAPGNEKNGHVLLFVIIAVFLIAILIVLAFLFKDQILQLFGKKSTPPENPKVIPEQKARHAVKKQAKSPAPNPKPQTASPAQISENKDLADIKANTDAIYGTVNQIYSIVKDYNPTPGVPATVDGNQDILESIYRELEMTLKEEIRARGYIEEAIWDEKISIPINDHLKSFPKKALNNNKTGVNHEQRIMILIEHGLKTAITEMAEAQNLRISSWRNQSKEYQNRIEKLNIEIKEQDHELDQAKIELNQTADDYSQTKEELNRTLEQKKKLGAIVDSINASLGFEKQGQPNNETMQEGEKQGSSLDHRIQNVILKKHNLLCNGNMELVHDSALEIAHLLASLETIVKVKFDNWSTMDKTRSIRQAFEILAKNIESTESTLEWLRKETGNEDLSISNISFELAGKVIADNYWDAISDLFIMEQKLLHVDSLDTHKRELQDALIWIVDHASRQCRELLEMIEIEPHSITLLQTMFDSEQHEKSNSRTEWTFGSSAYHEKARECTTNGIIYEVHSWGYSRTEVKQPSAIKSKVLVIGDQNL